MNGSDLISKMRLKIQDNGITQLWSDDELLNNINEAFKTAALRSNIISVKLTVPSVSGTSGYSTGSIYRTTKVRYNGRLLKEISIEDFDKSYPNGVEIGYVTYWYVDEDDIMYLSGSPDTDDVPIVIEGYALPTTITDLEVDVDFPDAMIEPALNYAYKLCYEKLDAEVSRPELAAFFDNEFVKIFGFAKTAQQWKKQRRSVDETVKFNYRRF